MFSGDVLEPVVSALQETITYTDVINLFASGVKVALPLILTWFGAKWVKLPLLPTLNCVNA